MSEFLSSACEYAENPNRLATVAERDFLHGTMLQVAQCYEEDMHSGLDVRAIVHTELDETLTYRKESHVYDHKTLGNSNDYASYSITYKGPLEKIPESNMAVQRVLQWAVIGDVFGFGQVYSVFDEDIILEGHKQVNPGYCQVPGYELGPNESAAFDQIIGMQQGTREQYMIIAKAAQQMIEVRRRMP